MAFTRREYETISRKCGDVPSHQVMARRRALRERLAETVDPLAEREEGWVVTEAKRRAEARAAKLRLAQRRSLRADFMPHYEAMGFRQATKSGWVNGTGHETVVVVADHTGSPPYVWSDATKVWDDGGKLRSGTRSEHRFALPLRWRQRVGSRGLAEIDGCLTIDATAIPKRKRGAHEAYDAVWCRQGRGTSLVQEHGVIVRLAAELPWVHGPDLSTAVRTAKRREAADRREAEAARDRAAARAAIEARLAAIDASQWHEAWPGVDLDSLQVCVRDSLAAGNCETGTVGWIERMLPQYADCDCAPALVVLEAIDRDGENTRRLAVAAVHRAVLRTRRAA